VLGELFREGRIFFRDECVDVSPPLRAVDAATRFHARGVKTGWHAEDSIPSSR
jgi:hypothetical protein